MRISDWSSDVCSSDLFGPSMVYRDFSVTSLVAHGLPVSLTLGALALALALSIGIPLGCWAAWRRTGGAARSVLVTATLLDRKSVVWGKSVAVRVDLGCRRIIQKKKN